MENRSEISDGDVEALVASLGRSARFAQQRTIEAVQFDTAGLQHCMTGAQVANQLRIWLAFLAPDIQRAILSGEPIAYPVGEIPLSWPQQRLMFGLTPVPSAEKSTL